MCMSVITTITGFKYFNFCPTHSAVCLFLSCVSCLVKLNYAYLALYSILQIKINFKKKFPANHECLLNYCGINFLGASCQEQKYIPMKYTRSLCRVPGIASDDHLPMPPSPPIRSTSIGCSGLFSEGVSIGMCYIRA